MGNCLKTQLKETVANDDLVVMGNFRIKVKANPSATVNDLYCYIQNLNGMRLDVVKGSGHFGLSENDITHTSLLVNDDYKTLYFENTDFEIECTNKYSVSKISTTAYYANTICGLSVDEVALGITTLFVSGTNWCGNIKNIANVTYLTINKTNISGDIEVFRNKAIQGNNDNRLVIANNPNIYGDLTALNSAVYSVLDLDNSNITGNLNTFIPSANATTLVFRYMKLQGSIEQFATNIASTRTDGSTLRCSFQQSEITYNGNPITTDLGITFHDGSNPTIAVV